MAARELLAPGYPPDAMITDLDCMVTALEKEIETEPNRTGVRDPAHFAYSILAKATIVRR
jgi:hypothetical protein